MDKIVIMAEDIKYEHLLGKPYVAGIQDCGALVSAFYKENFNIELTNYARPDNWWQNGMNIFYDIFAEEGFRAIDIPINKLQIGDVMLMGFGSQFPNHLAIYVGNGKVIHHLHNKLSTEDSIGHAMRDALLAIIRRPDIIIAEPELKTLRLEDIMSPYWKQRLANDPRAQEYLDSLKSKDVSSSVPTG